MKTYRMIASVLLGSLVLLTACSDDKEVTSYFNLDDNVTGITVPAEGIEKSKMASITVRSNSAWTVTAQTDSAKSWIHIFVDEGQDDGIFHYWVDANKAFVPRTGNIIFTVNGSEHPTTYRIDQEADVPSITIAHGDKGYEFLPAGGQLKIPVTHNISFETSLSDASWAKIDSVGKDTVYISAEKNEDVARKATLTLKGTGEHSGVTASTTLSQAAAGVVLNEHFDWMSEGIEDFYYNYPEQNYTKWSADEKGHGWTTIGDCMYGGRGYLKLGKTNDAGDLVSPKLTSINGKADVVLTFKCIGYVSKGGAKDDGTIRIMVVGPGSIKGEETVAMDVNGTTYQAATRTVTVYPNSSLKEHGDNYEPWKEAGATFTVHLSGLTSESQLLFVGGTHWGKTLKGNGQGKNRILIDDIKVVEE